jgi:type I restriction-modification system DNA methylase subunit
VDRTDWKSYILPMLFFKRICDVWDEERAEMVAAYGEAFADEHRFQVPEGCHWRDMRETTANVGSAIVHAMRDIERANQEHLYGVIGDAYEYLLKKFAGHHQQEGRRVLHPAQRRAADGRPARPPGG